MIEITIKLEKVNHQTPHQGEDIGFAVSAVPNNPTDTELSMARTTMEMMPFFLNLVSQMHGSDGALMAAGPDMEQIKAEVLSRVQNNRDAAG